MTSSKSIINKMDTSNTRNSKKKRSFKETWKLTYEHLKRTGFFKEVGKPLLKLVIIIIVIFTLAYFIGNNAFDIEAIFNYIVDNVHYYVVFVIFFLLEAVLPLLPVQLFIFWTHQLPHPWLCLTILAIISYGATLTAYGIGRLIRKIPAVNTYFILRFDKHIKNSKKWGGYLIAIAALTPLPFTLTIISMGLIRYPFRLLAFWAIFRIVHFYLYAVLIDGIL